MEEITTESVTECVPESIAFERFDMVIGYELGTGDLSKSLPTVVQTPDCGLPIASYLIEDI